MALFSGTTKQPEPLSHAVTRMRSQGYNTRQIAGQIKRWHPDWTPNQVTDALGAHAVAAKPTYHQTRVGKPFYPGQKPDHYQPAGRGGAVPVYKLGHGQAGQSGDKVLKTVLGGPAAGQTVQQSQASLAKVYRQNHPLGQQIIQGVADTVPGVSLAKGLRDSHVNVGTVASEAFNDVTSGLVPAVKVAGIFGGLRGLKGLRDAADTAKVVDAGRVAEKLPTAASLANSRAEVTRLKQVHAAVSARHEAILARSSTAKAVVAANEKRAARLASIQDKIAAHEQNIARGEDMTLHQKVQTNLRTAKATRTKQAAGYSVEKTKRVAAAEQALHSQPGMAGFRAALAEHRGELPKINFTGFGDLTPENLDQAAEIVKTHPHLQHYDKIRVAKALSAAVHEGRVPTPSDLRLIEHVFGKDTNGALQKGSDASKIATVASEVWNAPRAITASVDASGLFRQALVLGARHPNVFRRNIKTYFTAMAKESNYVKTLERIHADPAYPMANTAGLAVTDLEHGLGNREENFFSVPLIEKVTGGKHSPIRMSGRGYTAGLDAMRFDVFKQMLRSAQSQGINIHDDQFLKSLGRHINTMTGRGQSGVQAIEQAMPFFNNLLFSPRLLKSRFDIFLNPLYYRSLHPFVRRQAMKAAFATLGEGMTILGLAAMAGGKVGMDPTSADFGKIRLGNTRIDIWGGFQQPARLLAQIAEGHVTSTTTGKTLNLGPTGPGKLSRGDIALRFGVSKLAPSPSFVWDAAFGRNQIGQKFNVKNEALNRLWPLALQDANDLRKQHHGGMNGIEAALGGYLLSGLGFGVQTYGPKKPSGNKPPFSSSSYSGGFSKSQSSSSGGLFGGSSSSSGGLFGR